MVVHAAESWIRAIQWPLSPCKVSVQKPEPLLHASGAEEGGGGGAAFAVQHSMLDAPRSWGSVAGELGGRAAELGGRAAELGGRAAELGDSGNDLFLATIQSSPDRVLRRRRAQGGPVGGRALHRGRRGAQDEERELGRAAHGGGCGGMRGRYKSMVRAMEQASLEPVVIEDLVKFGEGPRPQEGPAGGCARDPAARSRAPEARSYRRAGAADRRLLRPRDASSLARPGHFCGGR